MTRLSLVTEDGGRAILTRNFAAPPALVYRAHTEAALIRRWLIGPPGWSMPVCDCDARPGGGFRYEFADANGQGFHITGEFLELAPPGLIRHVERMFLPDRTPENRVETRFDAIAGGTRLTMVMDWPDNAAREAMLATGMADGMEASFGHLETLLQEI